MPHFREIPLAYLVVITVALAALTAWVLADDHQHRIIACAAAGGQYVDTSGGVEICIRKDVLIRPGRP
jgi:hypothetical protein